MKIAFPVSLDERMVEWIKNQVDLGNFRNRSHLVEQALTDFKSKTEKNVTLKSFIKKE
jgi:Arc/MetJ-type ribon-helix-helix transcriptional regulator